MTGHLYKQRKNIENTPKKEADDYEETKEITKA